MKFKMFSIAAVCALAGAILAGCTGNEALVSYTAPTTSKPTPTPIDSAPPPNYYGDSLSATINGAAWISTTHNVSVDYWTNDYNIACEMLSGMVGSDTMRLNIPTVTTVTTGLLWNTDNDLTTGEYAIGNGEDFPYEPAGRFDFSFNSKTLSATSFNSDCWDGAIDVTYYNWYYMAGTFSFDDDGVNVTNGYFAFKVQ